MSASFIRIPYYLFGISLIAFGIQQWVSGQIVIGRPVPWPSSLPGEFIVAYLLGAWLMFNAVSIFTKRNTRLLLPTAWFILVWCASQNLYTVIFHDDIGISLTNFGKGISLAAGFFLIAMTSAVQPENNAAKPMNQFQIMISVYCLAFFLLASGVQHFIYADFVKFLVPAWIPFPSFWTYASGILLAAAGLSLATGIQRPRITRFAALMIFSWVIVLHIPRVLQNVNNLNEWIAVFEALAFSAILFIIANTPSFESSPATGKQFELVEKE